MKSKTLLRGRRISTTLVLLMMGGLCGAPALSATDFFLTIGGGYDRSGNQASLEANVVFFQQLLTEKHRGPRQRPDPRQHQERSDRYFVPLWAIGTFSSAIFVIMSSAEVSGFTIFSM